MPKSAARRWAYLRREISVGITDVPLDGPAPDRIMEPGTAFEGFKTLLSAVELGVLAALAPGPLQSEELGRRLGLHLCAARDFFDALVALGMLDRDDADDPCDRNAVETDLFLDPAKFSYVGGKLEMLNTRQYAFLGSLTDAVRTGAPQNEVRGGEEPIAQLYADPDRLAGVLAAMSAGVYVMGRVLHDWSLDEKRSLLRRTYDSLPEGGAAIGYEALIDDERRVNAFGRLMSLMLIETPGGFDYTGADRRAWMAEAGFRECYVQHLVGPDSMVVGVK
jgi:hypothetical protein